MARYYSEMFERKVVKVVAQDDTGVYASVNKNIVLRDGPRQIFINFPGWKNPRKVLTTDKQYLEFIRLYERSSYMRTRPTEIKEIAGSAKEVIKRVLAAGGV